MAGAILTFAKFPLVLLNESFVRRCYCYVSFVFVLGSVTNGNSELASKRESQWHRAKAKAEGAGKGGILSGVTNRRKAHRQAKRATNIAKSAEISKATSDPKKKAKGMVQEAKGFTSGKNTCFRRRFLKQPLFQSQ